MDPEMGGGGGCGALSNHAPKIQAEKHQMEQHCNDRVPTAKTLLWKTAVEFLFVLCLGYPMLHIYVIFHGQVEPTKRGFFCDDESLKHPYKEEEITVGQCVVIWVAITHVIVILVELVFFQAHEFRQNATAEAISKWLKRPTTRFMPAKIPWVLLELYRIFGYYWLGALATLLTTEMAKYKIGRLRPYFLTVCELDLNKDLCKDQNGYNIFVEDYECPGALKDAKKVSEAMKSFLSGHSSFSFYSAIFLVIFLQARLSATQNQLSQYTRTRVGWRRLRIAFRLLRIARPFLQFMIFALAFYIALSRIADYRHHPGDVLTGVLVGAAFAAIVLVYTLQLFRKPKSFWSLEQTTQFLHEQQQSNSLQLTHETAAAGNSANDSVFSAGPKPAGVPLKCVDQPGAASAGNGSDGKTTVENNGKRIVSAPNANSNVGNGGKRIVSAPNANSNAGNAGKRTLASPNSYAGAVPAAAALGQQQPPADSRGPSPNVAEDTRFLQSRVKTEISKKEFMIAKTK